MESSLKAEQNHQNHQGKLVLRGEFALLVIVLINSFGVVLMLHSGSGISAISSVPYAFAKVLPVFTLGTWTYIFQGILVLSLLIMRKKFVPQTMMLRIAYFVISYLTLCVGIALSNRCKMPIVPTDLFPREVSAITKIPYSRVKVTFDVCCLAVTAILTFAVLGHIDGLGIGTVLAAFTMGKVIGKIGEIMDRHLEFVSFLSKQAGSRSAY